MDRHDEALANILSTGKYCGDGFTISFQGGDMEHCSKCNTGFKSDPDAEFWFCPTCDTKNMCKGATIHKRPIYNPEPTPPPHSTPSEHRVQEF